jgi:hypothetical protein
VSTHLVDANPSLKRFDPQIWLPLLTFAWGVTSVAQGLVTNQAGLFSIRVREWRWCVPGASDTDPSTRRNRSRSISRRGVHILRLLPSVKAFTSSLIGLLQT